MEDTTINQKRKKTNLISYYLVERQNQEIDKT